MINDDSPEPCQDTMLSSTTGRLTRSTKYMLLNGNADLLYLDIRLYNVENMDIDIDITLKLCSLSLL